MGLFGSLKVMSLTDSAAERVRDVVAGSEGKAIGLRVGIKNGGCAGMSYTVELADRVLPGEDVVEDKGATVIVDPKAVLFLLGTEMDFERTKVSAQFTFKNPNQTSACGCGESVALSPASLEQVTPEQDLPKGVQAF